jgi:hypothetical protein
MNQVAKTSGTAWGCGAISTAQWTGVSVRDVLVAAGLSDPEAAGVAHVSFVAADDMRASVPVEKVGESALPAAGPQGCARLPCVPLVEVEGRARSKAALNPPPQLVGRVPLFADVRASPAAPRQSSGPPTSP